MDIFNLNYLRLISLLLLSCGFAHNEVGANTKPDPSNIPHHHSVSAKHLISITSGLNQPVDVAVSSKGLIYVINGINSEILVFNHKGQLLFNFGRTINNQPGLKHPMGLVISNKNIIVADTGNHRLVLFNLAGKFEKAIPLSTTPKPEPVALSLDKQENHVVWSDRHNHQICKTNITTGKTYQCWGKRGSQASQFQFPFQITFDPQGYLHVTDILNARIQVFFPDGQYFMKIGRTGIRPDELYRPNGLAFDKQTFLYVTNNYRGTISIFKNGRALGYLSLNDGTPVQLKSPVGMAYYNKQLYITDALRHRVEIFKLEYHHLPVPEKTQPQAGIDISRKNCIICHLSWSPDYKKNTKPEPVLPVSSFRMCYSCHHGAVIDSRSTIGHKSQHPDIHNPKDENNPDNKPSRDDKIPTAIPLVEKESLYCGSCHDPHVADKDGITLYQDHTNPWLRISNHDGKICHKCHQSYIDDIDSQKREKKGVNHSIGTILKKTLSQNATGYTTNEGLYKGLPSDLLSLGAALSSEKKMICQSCHQIHGGEKKSLTVNKIEQSELCISCHQRQYADSVEEARKKGVHPVNIKLDTPIKLDSEEIQFLTCLSCHSAHEGKNESALLKFKDKQGALCIYCHKEYDAVADSDHNLQNTASDNLNIHSQTPIESGLCGNCHSLHKAQKTRPFLSAVPVLEYEGDEKPLARDRLCLDCHHEKGAAKDKRVKYFSHPLKDLVLRSDPEVMPLINDKGDIDEFGSIACITCHRAHHWENESDRQNKTLRPTEKSIEEKNQEGNVLNSFLRNKGVKNTFCVDCHGIEAKPRYKYYHDDFVRPSVLSQKKK